MRITAGLIALALVFAGCAKKPEIQEGATVKFDYVLKVDGAVVDSSAGRGPMTYVQGGQDIIPGLQKQMVGLHVGDKKSITVTPEEGYGPVHPEAMRSVPKVAFNDAASLKVGDMVRGNGNGQQFAARVTEITADSIRLDMNHPLAGKTLMFDVTVVEITPPGKGGAAAPGATPPPASPGNG